MGGEKLDARSAESTETRKTGAAESLLEARPWGVFYIPTNATRDEWKSVRSGEPLPSSWRGFVSEHPTREVAFDAWQRGQFCRAIA